jgi:predicted Zn-ribbon and HTH transcriptional regulator
MEYVVKCQDCGNKYRTLDKPAKCERCGSYDITYHTIGRE